MDHGGIDPHHSELQLTSQEKNSSVGILLVGITFSYNKKKISK